MLIHHTRGGGSPANLAGLPAISCLAHKALAKEMGLTVAKHKTYGWSLTDVTPVLVEKYRAELDALQAPLTSSTAPTGGGGSRRSARTRTTPATGPPGDLWEPCGEGLTCVEGLSCWYQGKTGGPWFDACGVECMTDAECQDQGADVRCVGHCLQTCTQQSDCPGQMACVAICANIRGSEEPAGT